MKALVVENNVSAAEDLRDLLTEQGWDVEIAHFWKKAQPRLKVQFFDLLVLEILLPDAEGLEILKTLPENSKNPSIYTAVLSGFVEFSSAVEEIHPSLKDKCLFLKKPFEEETFLRFLRDVPKVADHLSHSSILKLFSESESNGKPFFETVAGKRMFQGHDLILILMEAHHQKWTGTFKMKTAEAEETSFYFEKGMIYKISKDHMGSIFGKLLIKHGLVLNEDIQNIIDENRETTSGLFIGKKLIAQGLLSPHVIQLILKDQIKIRLLESLNSDSFQLEIKQSHSQEMNYEDKVYFIKQDFTIWLIEALNTHLRPKFFQYFLPQSSYLIQKLSSLPDDFLSIKHKFLSDYIHWFQNLKDGESIENILSDSKDKQWKEKLLCFSLCFKFIQLKEVKKSVQKDPMMEISHTISFVLDENSRDIFKITGLAKTASEEELKSKYRQLTKLLHPDFIPQNVPLDLRQKAEKACQKLQSLYDIVSDKDKREAYIKSKKEKEFMDIINIYTEGLKQIKEERYYEGLKSLSKIENSSHAPQDVTLYMIWAKLKMLVGGLNENRREMTEIKKHIDLCSVSLQISHLFWYVKGLFCLKLEKYEQSREFLKKSLQLKGSFEEAKKDLIFVNQKIKKMQSKTGLLAFFQKKTG